MSAAEHLACLAVAVAADVDAGHEAVAAVTFDRVDFHYFSVFVIDVVNTCKAGDFLELSPYRGCFIGFESTFRHTEFAAVVELVGSRIPVKLNRHADDRGGDGLRH